MSRNYYTEVIEDQNGVALLDGDAFRFFSFGDILAEGTKEFLIYVPPLPINTYFYGRTFAGIQADLRLDIFQDPTFSNVGSSLNSNIFNRDANAVDDHQLLITEDPVISTDGQPIDYDRTTGATAGVGGKGSVGSEVSQEFPRILKEDSYMLVRITNLSATETARFIYKIFWSEIEVS